MLWRRLTFHFDGSVHRDAPRHNARTEPANVIGYFLGTTFYKLGPLNFMATFIRTESELSISSFIEGAVDNEAVEIRPAISSQSSYTQKNTFVVSLPSQKAMSVCQVRS